MTALIRLGLPALLIALLLPGSAHAERRRVRLGVQPLYALALVDRRDPSGGGVGLDLAFGITDALSLRATGFASWHAAAGMVTPAGTTLGSSVDVVGPSGTIGAFGAFAGLTYSLDVLRIVPSFDLGVGVIGLRGDPRYAHDASAAALLAPVTAFAVELGLGVDYLITRRWSVGVVARYHVLLTALQIAPSFLYVGPRVSLSLPF